MSSNTPAPKGTPYPFPAGVKVGPSAPRIVNGTLCLEHTFEAQGKRKMGRVIDAPSGRGSANDMSGGRD